MLLYLMMAKQYLKMTKKADLILFDSQAIILKLDVKLQTYALTGPPFANANSWVS